MTTNAVAMISETQVIQVRQSLTLGTARAALPSLDETVAAGGILPALAVAAMTVRFARREVAASVNRPAVRRLPIPTAPLLSENLRVLFLRMMRIKHADNRTILFAAALDRMAQCGVNLHPFDLPALSGILHFARSRLGPVERTYLALTNNEAAEVSPLLGIEITPANWRDFGKAERVAFLHTLRNTDPNAARILLETDFSKDPAATRAELVQTLWTGLSSADQLFLESLAQDRAESVRNAAAAILQGVRGSAPYNARLAEFASRLKVEQKSKCTALSWTRPDIPRHAVPLEIIRQMTSGLYLSDVATHLGIATDAFASFKIKDDLLIAALLRMAVAEGLLHLIEPLATLSEERDGPMFLSAIHEILPEDCGGERMVLLRPLLVQRPLRLWPKHNEVALVAEALRGPLPVDLAETLLASDEFAQFIASCTSTTESYSRHALYANLIRLATLIPAELAKQFRASLDEIVSPDAIGAQLFTDFQAALAAETNISA